jgi:carboxymethylenebutenolidase
VFARREVLKGIAAAPFAGIPLAAILAGPKLAGAAASLGEYHIYTPMGRSVSGALAMPIGMPAPAVVLIHEWWGLNDRIKAVTAEFARLGYLALAVDLMGGKVATSEDEALAIAGAVKPEEATDTLAGWIEWLGVHDASTRKIGTVGWGFGGAWSLNAAIAAPVDAAVVYYGNVAREAADLAKLKGPVLGHFATRHRAVKRPMVSGWEKRMDQAGKAWTTHWYDADHGFANPTSARYKEAEAKLAWRRTLDFFGKHL